MKGIKFMSDEDKRIDGKVINAVRILLNARNNPNRPEIARYLAEVAISELQAQDDGLKLLSLAYLDEQLDQEL